MALPNFGFNQAQAIPVPVAAAPVAQAPAAAFGPSPDLMALGTTELFEGGKQRLPYGGYRVLISKIITKQTREHGNAFIAEYSVTASNNPDVPVGRVSSYFREMNQNGIAYLALWLCDVLGVQGLEQRKQVQRMLPFIVNAEVTGQPTQVIDLATRQPVVGADGQPLVVTPGNIVGREFYLSVEQGSKPSKKTGKIYDIETWTPVQDAA